MRQFYKLADCIPYAPVLAELEAQPELWDGDARRQDADGSPHKGAPDLWLCYRPLAELREPRDFIVPFIPAWYPAWYRLPALHPVIYALSGMLRAVQIGGVLITKIPPGGRILPHHDRGSWHAEFFRVLSELFILRGVPAHIRSDNGPEFIAQAVRGWISGVGSATAFIEPGSPWENGYVESFNGTLRDELLNCELFNTLAEARVLIEQWRMHYNTVRPHASLGQRPPAPEVWLTGRSRPLGPGPTGSPQQPAPTMHQYSTRTTSWGLDNPVHHAAVRPQLRSLHHARRPHVPDAADTGSERRPRCDPRRPNRVPGHAV